MTLNPHPERDYLPAKQCDCTRLEQQKADELARVTAERDRLREALKECVKVLKRSPKPGLRPDGWEEAMKQAKAALDGTKGEQ